MNTESDAPELPDDFWDNLPPALRAQVVNILVEVAYEVVSAKSVVAAVGEKGKDDDAKQGEG